MASSGNVPNSRNSVMEKVHNRNNRAELHFHRQMTDFKKHLTFRLLAIEMDRSKWATFFKQLHTCQSDDMAEFVPILISELGEKEYTARVRQLKTRFHDVFSAAELGLADEIMPMNYVKIREAGKLAEKKYRKLKKEHRNMPKPPPPPPPEEPERPSRPEKQSITNDTSAMTGFITSFLRAVQNPENFEQENNPATAQHFPGIKISNSEPDYKHKGRDIQGSITLDNPKANDELKINRTIQDSKPTTGSDRDVRKMRRGHRLTHRKPLGNRIEEFLLKIDEKRCFSKDSRTDFNYLPPIGINAY